jgi:DNA-binding response OmpR family regulator
METKKVILADSSYTIRRITELSFSEEEGIELITLENGFNIKDKLIELKPAVVLVDIKLSGLNGYDICKFISETESLKDVQVFLMKGGFEPINEGLLKDLKYVDIITKPFDSNELVSSIKDMLDKGSVKAPPIAPEDLPEIDSIEEDEEDISFSDIEDELGSDKIISEDMDQEKEEEYMEEVLPSEEITQGPQMEKESPLDANTYDTDEIENPFKEEKAVIKEESLVKEEIKVEKELIKTEETEKKLVEEKEKEIFEKVEEKEEVPVSEKEEQPIEEKEVKIVEKEEEKVEDFFAISKAEEPSEPVETEETEEKPVDEKEVKIVEKEEEKIEDFFTISEAEEPSEPVETEETEEKPVDEKEKEIVEKEEVSVSEKEEQSVEEKVKDFFAASETKESSESDELEEAEEQLKEEKAEKIIEEKIEIEEEIKKEEIKIEKKVEKPEPAAEKKEFEYVEEMSQEQKEEIFEKVEDKMTLVIKEILWEIVPSLADKIIKEEISKIKSDMNG